MWETIADLFEIRVFVETILSDFTSFRFDRFDNSDTRRRITDSLFNRRRWFDSSSRNSVLKEVNNFKKQNNLNSDFDEMRTLDTSGTGSGPNLIKLLGAYLGA